jgi:16S rRNA (guanine(966)-N(2))-methyltransferase RsmD
MRAQLRIVAGTLKGRKLSCQVGPHLRPTPDMVRGALFSILGNAVPDRPFFDVFAGTGVVGLEAISRGARSATFVERDFRLTGQLERHLEEFRVAPEQGILVRADVYRWAERWEAPDEPVNVFLSPPFPDFERKADLLMAAVAELVRKVRPGSVIVVQGEHGVGFPQLPDAGAWEQRRYGRNELWIRVIEEPEAAAGPPDAPP